MWTTVYFTSPFNSFAATVFRYETVFHHKTFAKQNFPASTNVIMFTFPLKSLAKYIDSHLDPPHTHTLLLLLLLPLKWDKYVPCMGKVQLLQNKHTSITSKAEFIVFMSVSADVRCSLISKRSHAVRGGVQIQKVDGSVPLLGICFVVIVFVI